MPTRTRQPRTEALPGFHQPSPFSHQDTELGQPTAMPGEEAPMDRRQPGASLESDPPPPAAAGETGSAFQRDLPVPRLAPPDRTRTSATASDDDAADPKMVAGLAVALVGALMLGASAVLVRLRNQRLRQPTPKQTRVFGTAASKILLRRFEIGRLAPDLLDVVKMASAAGAYIEDGPMLLPREVDARVATLYHDDDDEEDED